MPGTQAIKPMWYPTGDIFIRTGETRSFFTDTIVYSNAGTVPFFMPAGCPLSGVNALATGTLTSAQKLVYCGVTVFPGLNKVCVVDTHLSGTASATAANSFSGLRINVQKLPTVHPQTMTPNNWSVANWKTALNRMMAAWFEESYRYDASQP